MIAKLAIVLSVAAEALIAYTLAELFATGYDLHEGAIPAVSWIFLGLVAFGLPQLTSYFGVSRFPRIALVLGVAFIAVVGVFRIEFAGDVAVWDLGWAREFLQDTDQTSREAGPVFMNLLLVIILWARCAYRAVQEIDLEGLPKSIAPGFAIVTIAVILGAMSDRSGEVARAAAVFYGVALLALAFSQMAMSGATIGDVRAGGLAGVLLGGVLGVTVVGVVLFMVVFGLVWPAVSPALLTGISWVVTIILTPPAWLLTQIFSFIFGLFGTNEIQITPAELNQTFGELPDEEETRAEKVGGFALRTVGLLVVVTTAAIVAVIFSAFRKRGGGPRPPGPGSSAAGSLGEDLRGLFRNVFRRQAPADQPIADSEVAKLYGDVLRKAAATGRGREPAETPAEFAPVVADRLHTGPVTDEITRVFIQARYAGRQPDSAELARLRRAWDEASARAAQAR